MLRSAPLFAAWCAADPGSVVPGGGSRLCGAAQGRCTASGTRDRRSHLRMRAIRGNQKGGLEARRLIKPFPIMPGCPGEARLHPGFEGYFLDFFFDFDFFAFFAFFAFLAIVSSQGFNGWKRDTRHARRRASLATSSKVIPTDSRRAAPRCHVGVIALSTADMRFETFSPN